LKKIQRKRQRIVGMASRSLAEKITFWSWTEEDRGGVRSRNNNFPEEAAPTNKGGEGMREEGEVLSDLGNRPVKSVC